MKVVIFAGGRGSRLAEETSTRPKPMVEVGGLPILVHLMRWYASFGHNEFVIACGYKSELIKDYFFRYREKTADFTIDTASGTVEWHSPPYDDWKVTLVDTGLDTMTGGRLARLQQYVGTETFLLTYGDGLSDVNIDALVDHHKALGRMATVTAVVPPARFGSLLIGADSLVESFAEKIPDESSRINGGFFVLEPGVFDYVGPDEQPFEQEPLSGIARAGELSAYQHDGFWKPMDTLRDRNELEALWDAHTAPWLPK